jgi:hypothetical protein
MCISNGIQIWPKDVISHIFKENQESSPYIYASDMCNNFVCEHELRDAHDRRITTNRLEKHMLSLAKPVKLEHPVYKTGTFGFFRLSILTRTHSSLHFRHSINTN